MPATIAPQNPSMAANPASNIHNDTWMTDAYQHAGPVGRNLQTKTGLHAPSLCGSLAFDKAGQIVSICPSMFAAPQARVFDPKTLEVLATYDMPDAPNPPGTQFFQNFTGGGYFFLDGQDRIWSATKTSHLMVLAIRDNGRKLVKVADYDLSKVLTDNQRISSALPDWQGRIWFVSKKDGVIGVLDKKTGKIETITLNEEIENSFAVDRDGVYIVSDKRMYRFNAGKDNKPVADWKVTYKNSGITKPSQLNAGSGTTPTIFNGGKFVTITDNADPMNVVVYRTAEKLGKGEKRVVCETPVFGKGASATENSIIAAGNSLFVENNYGYQDPFGPNADAPTTAGFARIDVDPDGKRLQGALDEQDRAGADPRLQALDQDRPDLHLHRSRARRRHPAAVVLGRDRRPDRQGGLAQAGRHRPGLQQQLLRHLHRPRTAPPTSGRSAPSSRCATASA